MTRKIEGTAVSQGTTVTLSIVAALIVTIATGSFFMGRLSNSVDGLGTRVDRLEAQRTIDATNQSATNILLAKIQASLEDIKVRVQNFENRQSR
jgi:hypothetical protein